MRIVHITPFYHPVIGGVEEVVRRVAEYTTSKGMEVYIVTYNRLRVDGIGSLPREEEINGVHVIRLKPDFIWSHGTYSSELGEVLRRLRPDIVHAHVWRHPHVFQVAKLKERLRFKAVLHGHAPFHKLGQLGALTWLYHRVVDVFMKGTLRMYDRVIALTLHEKSVLVSRLGVDVERVIIIPNGIDDELLESPITSNCNENVVLYIGRVSRSKNLDLLVKALRWVEGRASVKLVLAGPDEGEASRLRDYAWRYHVNLRYLGTVSESEKRNLYAKCKVFVHPAVYEPFGITLLEVQAFGKPCVITGEGGQLYAAPPGKSSVYAEPNPRSFGKAVSLLLNDEELYMRLSKNAREWASKHAWSKILPRYIELYTQLMNG